MRFKIIPLEERVVYDAAGFTELIEIGEKSSYDLENEKLQEDNLKKAQKELDAQDPLLYQEADKLVEKAVNAQQDLNILIIPSNLEDSDYLASIASSNTLVVTLDAESSDLNSILENLSKTLGGRKADNIAFATHGDTGYFLLTDEIVVSQSSLESSTDLQSFFSKLALFVEDEGRVDILGCNLASSEDGLQLIKDLEELTQRNFAASIDLTGSEIFGANWVLETDNINTEATYFSSLEELNKWENTLDRIAEDFTIDIGSNSQRLEGINQIRSAEEEAIWYWNTEQARLEKVIDASSKLQGASTASDGSTVDNSLLGKIYFQLSVNPSWGAWGKTYHTENWGVPPGTWHTIYHSKGMFMHVNALSNVHNRGGSDDAPYEGDFHDRKTSGYNQGIFKFNDAYGSPGSITNDTWDDLGGIVIDNSQFNNDYNIRHGTWEHKYGDYYTWKTESTKIVI
ncbi:MAG: DUF4347 domain-containing protein [Chlamydiales bacterium]|nr:DUF4347 domain-containing protein [Chlamydiales bacterium]